MALLPPTSDADIAAAAETTESLSTNPERAISLSDLRGSTGISPTLWYRIHVLLFDLRHYSERADSKERLECVIDPSYIGPPYIEPEEAERIKNTVIHDGKKLSQVIEEFLAGRLNRRTKKRVDSGDFRVCAAHDLAPVLEKTLGIDSKQLARDKDVLRLLETGGLELGDQQWDGLPTKSFAPKGRKKKGKE
ncbi:hypothetical protein VTN96DRAFT_8373 [Rasamsonia emersonii]